MAIDQEAQNIKAKGDGSTLQPPDPNTASLQMPSVVHAAVQSYLQDVVSLRGDFLAGKYEAGAFLQKVLDRAVQAQDTFLARDNLHIGSDWNTVEKLGKYLVEHDVGGDPTDAVRRSFVHMAKQLGDAITAVDNGEMDATMLEPAVNELVTRYTAHMLGVPPETIEVS